MWGHLDLLFILVALLVNPTYEAQKIISDCLPSICERTIKNINMFYKYLFTFQHFASGHYETALLAITAGDAEDY